MPDSDERTLFERVTDALAWVDDGLLVIPAIGGALGAGIAALIGLALLPSVIVGAVLATVAIVLLVRAAHREDARNESSR